MEIKPGDLVVMLRNCCSDHSVGTISTVTLVCDVPTACWKCHTVMYGAHASLERFGNKHGVPISWLKRIPPLDELEDTKIVEELTA